MYYSGTSIKRRIETFVDFRIVLFSELITAVLPLKEGLKPPFYTPLLLYFQITAVLPLKEGLKHTSIAEDIKSSLNYSGTSIKRRIETQPGF